ncbi:MULTISPECIES: Trk system potassium transporter TrkA [Azorhizobium]|uniref:Trk system potassium uptake protein TrkA n=1 Tax=Azorhizobium caulinodans (strain ATCC 43989 / DSM 5975 / JCM 20966 / LMG 6465 / NBRC 14845 / NCIMB 13405 / ORS 571) TaxID=438753 RepID=TRKA_AZOC5|nr:MULTISPECIES: Trk system potassium transporter TrkA [Azorhizobium]Q04856.2 RecName: Full=Trk system potassium uptake protein TrkA; Short=K(+)-uptake protein TrkA [Azorhizobium caulinodans ORS 571]TDT93535.1 trk system potassium uptake protein TrkA [Azorhizobium sp. AG788]BAF89080.1 putative TRK system potassium uptake protein [Azorhizobium caulinodans ORS 571]
MKVVICGAGQVGFGIAERLASEQNDVSIVDASPRRIQIATDQLDVRGVVGHGSHPDVLARAGIEQADMLIAVTLHDEVNMVACQVGHSLFNVPTKVARIRAQTYLQPEWRSMLSRDHMPIDVVISPEIEVGEMVLRRLSLPGAVDTVSFGDGSVVIAGVLCGEACPVVDTPLTQLTQLFPDLPATIVAINRNGKVMATRSSDQIQTGDIAYFVAPADQVGRTLSIFGHDEIPAKRIIIGGGGNIGLYVAQELEKRNAAARIKVVESNRERAQAIAEGLSRSVVLHGDSLAREILDEAGVADSDTMIALTNDDRVNILSCLLAKQLGAQRILALVNEQGYAGFAHGLGIDAYVNPRQITVSKVLQHVRRGRIRGVHSLLDGAGEMIEAEALETSPLVGRPLRDIDLLKGMRIGAVVRNGVVMRPSGDTVVRAQDRVVLFALADDIKRVEQLFRVSLEFF